MDAEEWEEQRAREREGWRDPGSPSRRRWDEGREEMRAARAARNAPLLPVASSLSGATGGRRGKISFRGTALSLASKVVARAQQAGLATKLGAMERRMREWVEIVIRNAKDEDEMMTKQEIPLGERRQLVRQMRDTLRQLRVERFGA